MTGITAIALRPAWRLLAVVLAAVEMLYFASLSFVMIEFGAAMAAFDGHGISTSVRIAAYTAAIVITIFLALGVVILARPTRYSRKLSALIFVAITVIHAIALALLAASLAAALVGIARGDVGYDSIVWHSGLIATAIVVGMCAAANVVNPEH